jgi:hypothetical protein
MTNLYATQHEGHALGTLRRITVFQLPKVISWLLGESPHLYHVVAMYRSSPR